MARAESGGDSSLIEGVDVVNLGSDGVSGNNILNFAVGARIPFTRNLSFGTIYEFPVTNRRDTDDFDTARASASTATPTGSSAAGYRRVDRPANIAPTMWRANRSSAWAT